MVVIHEYGQVAQWGNVEEVANVNGKVEVNCSKGLVGVGNIIEMVVGRWQRGRKNAARLR